jgi:hypothetical protein
VASLSQSSDESNGISSEVSLLSQSHAGRGAAFVSAIALRSSVFMHVYLNSIGILKNTVHHGTSLTNDDLIFIRIYVRWSLTLLSMMT